MITSQTGLLYVVVSTAVTDRLPDFMAFLRHFGKKPPVVKVLAPWVELPFHQKKMKLPDVKHELACDGQEEFLLLSVHQVQAQARGQSP